MGQVVAGEDWAAFTRAKCCNRHPNRSSFYGFVNPTHYVLEVHDYSRHADTYLADYAAGDVSSRSLSESKELCDKLAGRCAGVTCNKEETSCTLRANGGLGPSPFGEVAYRKEAEPYGVKSQFLEQIGI